MADLSRAINVFTQTLMWKLQNGHPVADEEIDALNELRTEAGMEPIKAQPGAGKKPPQSAPGQPDFHPTAIVVNGNRVNAMLLPDNKGWTNRFYIKSESSDKLYTIAQNKVTRSWGCTCPGWIGHAARNCKHLKAMGLPGGERPYEARIEKSASKEAAEMIHSDNDLGMKMETVPEVQGEAHVVGPEAGHANDELHENTHEENGVPVTDGGLKSPERQNVNAIREALETQVEMEVGKPIEQKEQEVAMQEKVQDAALAQGAGSLAGGATQEVSAKPGTQIIINVASWDYPSKKAEMLKNAALLNADELRKIGREFLNHVRTAAVRVTQAQDASGFYMIINLGGREYVLRGQDADDFHREFSMIPKPEAKVNALVEKYMWKLQPLNAKPKAVSAPAKPKVNMPDQSGIPGWLKQKELEDTRARVQAELAKASSLQKVAYVSHCPGHTNSKGEKAEWCIKQHNTDKILESFKSEDAAKEGLKNMESHKHGAEGIGGEDDDKITSGQGGGMFGGTDLEGPSFHVGFDFRGSRREASFSTLHQAHAFTKQASARFGKLAGNWTMKCPNCHGEARKQNPEDNYICGCGWNSHTAVNERETTPKSGKKASKTAAVDPAKRNLVLELLKGGAKTTGEIEKALGGGKYTMMAHPILQELAKEGLVAHKQMRWSLKQAAVNPHTGDPARPEAFDHKQMAKGVQFSEEDWKGANDLTRSGSIARDPRILVGFGGQVYGTFSLDDSTLLDALAWQNGVSISKYDAWMVQHANEVVTIEVRGGKRMEYKLSDFPAVKKIMEKTGSKKADRTIMPEAPKQQAKSPYAHDPYMQYGVKPIAEDPHAKAAPSWVTGSKDKKWNELEFEKDSADKTAYPRKKQMPTQAERELGAKALRLELDAQKQGAVGIAWSKDGLFGVHLRDANHSQEQVRAIIKEAIASGANPQPMFMEQNDADMTECVICHELFAEPSDEHEASMPLTGALKKATIRITSAQPMPRPGTPEAAELKIAIQTLKMPEPMQGVMGGPGKEHALATLARYGLRWDDADYMAGGKGVKKAGDGMAKTEEQVEKEAGFNFFFPGQVVKEFYPEIQHEIVDYPNANNQPMGLESPEIVGDGGHELEGFLDDALDTSVVEMIQLPADVGGLEEVHMSADYSSTSPAGGLGIGRDGKPEVLEGAPLRKENDIRGYMFTDEFYGQYADVPGAAMQVASKTAADGDEAKQFAMFLKKVCGEIAATLVAAFKVTSRPLLDKVPGMGELQLDVIEQGMQTTLPLGQTTQGGRIKYLMDKLNDGDIKSAINEAWAQAAVWNDNSEGGFVYEVFVRPETIDTDSLVMKYKFVCGTRE